ncbi:MAG: RHS repeat-associated core domain-containing protein [Xanthomonadales bacterium]|nr:RHS repeat-associated core domain-containing protein [Xanthomonadales bacterium]
MTNDIGGIVERMSFDAHGNRRSSTAWQSPLGSIPSSTRQGFTGHHMLDVFGLIHMNGRVYDPQIGRFLQADVLLDAGIQGLNRYSYVLNNPLSLTDPSGHMSVGQILRTVAAIAITVYSGGTAAGAAWGFWGTSVTAGQALFAVAAGGFASGAIQSSSLKGGLTGAYTALAFYAVGSYFKAAEWASKGGKLTTIGRTAKIVAHGVVGGVSSELKCQLRQRLRQRRLLGTGRTADGKPRQRPRPSRRQRPRRRNGFTAEWGEVCQWGGDGGDGVGV